MLAPDTLLQNRYLIVRLLAAGGMGAVYQALDHKFGNTVALKESFFSDEILRKAFEREARLLNRLRHPILPVVFDYFAELDRSFLVMQFIPGDDLGRIMKERMELIEPQGEPKPFEPENVIEWADQLLDALDYIHTQEPPIIHRDIKPQNLKLSDRGQIILLDFGLAKDISPQDSSGTSSASILGFTPNYAPFEQMQAMGTDARSDLYSLAATLYHLITGVTPPDAVTRVNAVLNEQQDPLRPPLELNREISASVSELLIKAMALKRSERPASASEMRKVLRDSRRSSGTTHKVPTSALPLPAAALQYNPLWHGNLGNNLYHLGKYDEAEQEYRQASELDPNNAYWHGKLGDALFEQRKYVEAEQEYRIAVQLDPNNAYWHGRLLHVLRPQAKYDEIEVEHRELVRLAPNDPDALNELGWFLIEREEKLEEALEILKRALNAGPKKDYILDSLGWVYFKLGQPDEAERYLMEAVDLDTKVAFVYEHLGDLYESRGNIAEAKQAWQKALSLSRESNQIEKLKQNLSK